MHPLKLLCLGMLLVLSGCANLNKNQINRISSVEDLDYWQIEGKLGLRQNGKSQQVNVRWEHTDDNYHILLFGPFGRGKIQITKRDETIELTDGKDLYHAATAEQLLFDLSGQDMPISLLEHWILGIPAPDTPASAQRHNEEKALSSFEQAGWQVNYLSHTKRGNIELPTKIKLTTTGSSITIIIKRWKLAP